MSYKQQQRVRLFSIIATFLMIISLMTPALVVAESNDNHDRSLFNSQLNVLDKVSDRLQDEFAEEDTVKFLVRFTDKAEVEKVAEEARNQASLSNLSGQESIFLQRSAVVSELKATSLESQENVINYLEKAISKGQAENYHSYFIVNGLAVEATQEIAEEIAEFPEVEKVLPNETRELYHAPTIEKAKTELTSDEIEWNVDRVGAPAVWDMGINGTGTVVASIDSGVQWDHPALKNKYRGYNPETGGVNHDFNWYDATEGRSEPYDDIDHGTHVTGTMVGGEQDGSNQTGVAPGAKWIAVKAFTGSGGKDTDLLNAAEWIMAPTDSEGNERIDMAPDVVNNSWGGGPGLDEWYRDVVIAWRASNIFPEFSAGNTTLTNPGGPRSIATPANYPESFATGATDINDKIASFSLRGPSPYDEIKPDISAPGVNIRSSVPGNGYDEKNGTSMAGPAVSAVVALLRQVDSNMSVDDIEEILLNTAIPLTDDEYPESPNNGYGYGLVDAFEAVSFILDGLGAVEGTVGKSGEDDEEPTFQHSAPLETYFDMDTTLSIFAQDNVSILSVELEYKVNDGDWKTTEGTLVAGDYLDGEYHAEIDGAELEEGTLTYQWTINDYGGHQVTSEIYDVPIKSGVSIGYFEDFEIEPAGWTSFGEGDDWEWGVPTSGPEEAASGEHVYATNLNGSYTKGADATLVMPAVDLPEGDAYLHFDMWYDLEEIHDSGYVYVSTDQKEWKSKRTIFYASDGWRAMEADLSEYSGERVYIGFNITSNTPNEIEKPGIYLDNVGLSSTPRDASHTLTNELEEKVMHKQAEDMSTFDTNATLPLDANVSVLNTSRSTGTDPVDGSYRLTSLAEGNYTLQANAYGFYSDEQSVAITSNDTSIQDFILEEIPKGDITGNIIDETTGEAIEGATLFLIEDANVAPVTSDENGEYSIAAHQGTYTMKVIAKGYHNEEVTVTLDDHELAFNINLSPYFSYKYEEIAYDDGSAEIPRTFYDIGNRAAVKMSLPEEQDYALVTDGVFQFYGENQPRPGPGSTEFAVEVWDATGEDGLPGNKLAGPIEAEAIRDLDEWTVVDLSEENIIVHDDFYMVYVQTKADQYAPALGSDYNGIYANRSYEHTRGFWDKSNEIEGNYMIRSRVAYEVEDPVITSPTDDMITTDPHMTVEGTATPLTTIKLLNDGEEVARSETDEEGLFSMSLELSEGSHELTAVTLVEEEETKISNSVTVIVDTTAPDLTIDNPKHGEKTNRETVTVEGTVSDENLDYVEVNGQKADIDGDDYSKRILLDHGENVIEVTAVDLAGNRTTKSITIHVKYTAPEINNLTPAEDVQLQTGDSVKIEFDSERGLRATFVVHMPLTDLGDGTALASNPTELPMMEMPDGKYVGYWTVPANAYADGAQIEVKARDTFKNETRETADGKLFINFAE